MALTRELTITYNSVAFGGSTARQITDAWRLTQSRDGFELVFEFITRAATEAAFNTESAAVKAALRTPRADLTVVIGSTTFFAASHTSNTALNIRSSVEEINDGVATARSRRYRATISGGLPANVASLAGRRDVTIEVTYTPSRYRTMTVSGTFTAVSSTQAVAQYQAQITALVATYQSDLGGTWKAVTPEKFTRDDTDQTMTFSRSFREQRPPEARVTDAAFKIIDMTVSRSTVMPGDSDSSARRPDLVAVSIFAAVDKDSTTDLPAKWELLLADAAARVRVVSGAGGIALLTESPAFNESQGVISGTAIFQALVGGDLLEHTQTVAITDEKGVIIREAWGDSNLLAWVFNGPRRMFRSTITTIVVRGNVQPSAFGGGGGGADFVAGSFPGHPSGVDLDTLDEFRGRQINRGAGAPGRVGEGFGEGDDGGGAEAGGGGGSPEWILLKEDSSHTPATRGQEPYRFEVTAITTTVVERSVVRASAVGAGSGVTGGGETGGGDGNIGGSISPGAASSGTGAPAAIN